MKLTIDQLLKKLAEQKVDFKLHQVPQGTGRSVEAHIKALVLSYSDGCATLIFSTNKGLVALLRRDDTRVNSKDLKNELGISSLRLLSADELLQETGYEAGLVSPLSLNENIRVLLDKFVLEKTYVRVGTGREEDSLEINTQDLMKITGAQVVSVCEIDPAKNAKGKRILSGITPSSSKGLHLGNYLGAVKPQVEFQSQGECFYFIADYHALNTVQNAQEFANNTFETYLDYLALGVDLEKTTFFVESHVPAIFELTEILGNVITLAQMKRMHAYKDKLTDPDADVDNINMGLFNYPILMAADILIFEPDIIPVGEDQAQHVEVARDIAKSFNHRYGEILKVPDLFIKKEVARLTGTDGQRKMGKSLGNDLTIFADTETIRKQVMGITTDPNRIKADDPGDPEKNVIFTYLRLMGFDQSKLSEYEDRYRAGTIGDVQLKQEFLTFYLDYFAPVRERRAELAKDKEYILKLMKEQAAKANAVAHGVMERVRKGIGAIYT